MATAENVNEPSNTDPPASEAFLPASDSIKHDSLFTNGRSVSPAESSDADIIAKSRGRSVPSTPEDEARNYAPGIKRNARPGTIKTGSDDSYWRRRGDKSLGPRIPIKVTSPSPASPPPLFTSMSNMRSQMSLTDDDLTSGDTSDNFEDASESTPRPASAKSFKRGGMVKDRMEQLVGLGINGDTPALPRQLKANGGVMKTAQQNGNSTAGTTHSRQSTTETAPQLTPRTLEQELDGQTSMTPSVTSDDDEDSHVSLSGIRAGLQSHSRQDTAETITAMDQQSLEQGRERSMSPSKDSSRPLSPTKMARGLSGDVPIASPPPPTRPGKLERPSLSSPPAASAGLMRNASTRVGAFLGRMGTIRKPGRSPPGQVSEGRFERRNTTQSIPSLAGNGGDSLATIADGPEGAAGESTTRPSLQDQFRTLRKQEENSMSVPNDSLTAGDGEQTRALSDAGTTESSSPGKEHAEIRSHRSLSTSSLVKSPPMNPSLPPGTASGLTAGPAEEPQAVDWDLWQAVVNEGPSAVARTGGEELKRAIASGIPAAIRGVVWQVLAESKNAELEVVYRTLKAEGTADAEQFTPRTGRSGMSPSADSQPIVNGTADKADKVSQVSSSRSSVLSESSTPATSAVTSPPPSVPDDDAELKAKLLAEQQKRDAAALAKLEKTIKRDLGARTSYSKFTQAAGLQDGLFGVCKAYALYDEGVGYAQGINFIAMPLLFNMTEEEAFTLLVRLMSKYGVRSMFTSDMAGLHLRLYQFERLLEDREPALYCHLRRRNVGPQLYATQWFLTLFAHRFPLQLVLRVYDLVFSEGLVSILKFGLVLMQHNRDALLEMKDMSQLTTFLKEKVFDVYIDKSPSASSLLESGFFGSVTGGADKELYRADEMVRDACNITIDDATLALYTTEWEESQRVARERDSELEGLRSSNASLTSHVKALEERTQQQDAEHVNIAGDLVRLKVDNDKLMDENEGLKMKMEELQRLVDTQPAEVEARLKEEMNRILQRNGEVQNENRLLKEEMVEMEQELVDVKMKHAQVS